MSKVTVIGDVPGTGMHWERYEYDAYADPEGRKLGQVTDYLLVRHAGYRRKVLVNVSMEELVALRASIDDLIAAEANPPWRKSQCSQLT